MELDFDIETKGENLDFDLEEVHTIGTGGGLNEEEVRAIVSEETADLQPKVDERLITENKNLVEAINEFYDDFIGIVQLSEDLNSDVAIIYNALRNDYVKYTDYAGSGKAGVVKVTSILSGLQVDKYGDLTLAFAQNEDIKERNFRALSSSSVDEIVAVGMTTNTKTLTEEEKASARDWLGALAKSTEVTTRQQVYVKAPNGTQEMVLLTTDFASNAVPRYNVDGKMTCADPTAPTHTANKRFVEALIAELRAEIEKLKQ